MKQLLLMAGMGILFFTGCRHSAYTVIEKPAKPLGSFSACKIDDFTNQVAEGDQALLKEYAVRIAEETRSQVASSGVFTATGGPSLIVEGVVTGYRAPNTAMRWTVGYGAGEGYTIVRIRLKEAETGASMGAADLTVKITTPFGNVAGRNEAAFRVAQEIVNFLRAHK